MFLFKNSDVSSGGPPPSYCCKRISNLILIQNINWASFLPLVPPSLPPPFSSCGFPGGSWSGKHGQSRELHWLAAHWRCESVCGTGRKCSVQGALHSGAQCLLQNPGCSRGGVPTEEREGRFHLDATRALLHNLQNNESQMALNWPSKSFQMLIAQ